MSLDEPAEATRRELATCAARGTTVTYAELTERVPELRPFRDTGRLGALLRRVSLAEEAEGRGLLSCLVVRSDGRGLPGPGFFRLAADLGRDVADRRSCWEAERDRVYRSHRGN